jgi:hypothetical protein
MKLMEAHESALRALVLTADGSKLATASEKGTVIRIFDVATATCVQEFRRGFERATITCLAWSWDYAWLACTSDKGTSHVFQVGSSESASSTSNNKDDNKKKKSNHHNDTTATSLTAMIFSSVRKSMEGDAKKSVCQIRGVPHPQACAFIGEASGPNVQLAVAGWDADGNGVVLISECIVGDEPKRIGYHIVCRSEQPPVPDESDDARRRRRLRGWAPEVPATPEGGRLYVGERLEILERGMEQICFEENMDDPDEFVSVLTTNATTTTVPTPPRESSNKSSNTKDKNNTKKTKHETISNAPLRNGQTTTSSTITSDETKKNDTSPLKGNFGADLQGSNSQPIRDSGTVGGDSSVRTEPLDDD